MGFFKENWKVLTGLGIGLAAISIYHRKKISKFLGFSSFAGPGLQVMQFTLTNRTADMQTISLFNPFAGSAVDNPSVGILPSPFQFNQSLMSNPIKVSSIEIRGSGTANQTQANQPIQKMCADANGQSAGESWIPMMSAFQPQGGILTIQPNNLVLDGTCFLNYTLAPGTQIIFLVRYENLPDKPGFKKQGRVPPVPMPRTQPRDHVREVMDIGL